MSRRKRFCLRLATRALSRVFRVQVLVTSDRELFEEVLRFLEKRHPQRIYSWRSSE